MKKKEFFSTKSFDSEAAHSTEQKLSKLELKQHVTDAN